MTSIKARKEREGVALHLYDNDVAAGQSAELERSMDVIERYKKDRNQCATN
jgi:hypothetical protein